MIENHCVTWKQYLRGRRLGYTIMLAWLLEDGVRFLLNEQEAVMAKHNYTLERDEDGELVVPLSLDVLTAAGRHRLSPMSSVLVREVGQEWEPEERFRLYWG